MENILHSLAYGKANDILKTKKFGQATDFWKDYVGLPNEVASQFASQPARVQESLFASLANLSNLTNRQQPDQQQNAMQQIGQQEEPSAAEQLPMQQQPMAPQVAKPQLNQPQPSKLQPGQLPQAGWPHKKIGEAPVITKEQKQAEQKALIERKKAAKEVTRKSLEAQPKLTEKQQEAVNKSEKAYHDKLLAKYEVGKIADVTLDKMEKLVDEGSLPWGWTNKLLEDLKSSGKYISKGGQGSIISPISSTIGGVIIPLVGLVQSAQALTTSTDMEPFKKLTGDFIKGMKDIFGGNVSNVQMQTYIDLLPNLSQTDAGKKTIMKNMRDLVKADKIKYEAMRDIIRENGGRMPQNLGILVNERVDAELGQIAQDIFNPENMEEEAVA